MIICKVVKPLVSTNRIPDFEHKHLQVVLDGSTQKVAVDAVGCIPGDWVICVGSSAAREAAGSKSYPSDLTIVGIIDHWDPEAAKAPATATPAKPPAPIPSSSTSTSSPPRAGNPSAAADSTSNGGSNPSQGSSGKGAKAPGGGEA
jgi:ethanolamine utilization protein EutN